MSNKTIIKARTNNIAVQEAAGETLIYDNEAQQAYCLNETASYIWKNCDGSNSVSDISKLVSKKFDVAYNEDFVWLAIDQLKKDSLLENSVEVTSRFDGLSRREIIKKVGLAVAVFPIVASMSLRAQDAPSGVCSGTGCSTPASCATIGANVPPCTCTPVAGVGTCFPG
jgi:Coenzyme PQQ synthesis protein D (PqqD)